jgi:hypothetical protein
MSNYLKATDFGAKDALLSGDPNKIVKGTEINDEFDSIQTAVNSKANTNNAALTGTPTAPTATAGTNTTQVATTAFVKTSVDNYDAALTVSTGQIENDAVTTAKIAPTGVSAGSYGSSSAIPVVTVNAEGQVTSATTAAITITDPIGVNQTWQNVASSRALSTNYTNSTGRPIQVSASIYYGYDGTQAAAIVGGVTLCSMRVYSCCGVGVSTDYPLSFIVPAGATYQIQGGAIRQWAELR